jgi:nucleoside recognition membrane protein YjiH
MIAVLLIGLIVLGLPTLYLASRSRDFRRFLAGAFFVSAGIQFYLYLAKVSVPLLGTNLVVTPEISGWRSIVHFILFGLCLYFGCIQKPKGSGK